MDNNKGNFTTCQTCSEKFKFSSKEERLNWVNNKSICPKCGALYCNKPDPEPKLFMLQDEYLLSRNEELLYKIYKILIAYGKNLFFKTFRNTPVNTYDAQYYVENAVSLFIEECYYVKNKKIRFSFGGMLGYKIKQAVYGKSEKLISDISLDWIFQDDNKVQYEDKKNYFQSIEEECDKYYLVNNLYDIVLDIERYSTSPLENYLRELAIYIHLKKGEKYADKFFKLYRKICPEGKIIYMYTLDILKQRLKKEIEK